MHCAVPAGQGESRGARGAFVVGRRDSGAVLKSRASTLAEAVFEEEIRRVKQRANTYRIIVLLEKKMSHFRVWHSCDLLSSCISFQGDR